MDLRGVLLGAEAPKFYDKQGRNSVVLVQVPFILERARGI